MNIDIGDEIIEQMVKKQIEERVKAWFEKNHNSFIKSLVREELRNYKYYEVIQDEARKLVSKEVVDGVCRTISMDIANAIADKFDY